MNDESPEVRSLTSIRPPVEGGGPAQLDLPLVVDMDNTLLLSDTLLEMLLRRASRHPLQTLWAFGSLVKGRAAFKAALAAGERFDVGDLPARMDLFEYLLQQRARGRAIYLVSAADQSIVDDVAARFGLFDGAFGSRGEKNLKGGAKLEFLQGKFPGGFAYAGDAAADLKVWQGAQAILIVGASSAVASRAKKLGKPIEAEFEATRPDFRTWRKTLRLHQWAKNILVFVPLLLGVHSRSAPHIAVCAAGFVLVGLAASATYIINDLADLSSDRRHRSKRNRPLASGAMPLNYALVAAPLMLAVALAGALALSTSFAAALCVYLVVTLAYSFRLKRTPLLDVAVLSGLYTLRLVMGTFLAVSAFSPWLLTFSAFFFFAMSLAKRHVEVTTAIDAPPDQNLPGRGYRPSDAPLTLTLGVAASVASVLVIVEYMMADAFPSNVYDFPLALWAAPVLLSLWVCRIWLLAHRGELEDDPVAFAVKDRISLGLGALLGLTFVMARV